MFNTIIRRMKSLNLPIVTAMLNINSGVSRLCWSDIAFFSTRFLVCTAINHHLISN